jgi:3-hydroxy acid dehydrogenase / malonic semialdehyde reductase
VASLDGKRALVTGASSGIGAATVRALRDAGARVVGGARRTERVDADVALDLDVTDPASSRRFVEAAVAELGQLDVLVNNAGLALGREPFWEGSDEDEETVIGTNVLGLMRMTRLCLPHLADWSHIVNLGSVAGIWSYPSGSSYVASKFAVHGYTRAIRDDLQGRPVRVTNVAPGLVETEGFSKTRFRGDEEKAASVYANVAVGGPLHAEDVVDCIMFALTRPKHVNIDEIVVMALAQTSGSNVARTSP